MQGDHVGDEPARGDDAQAARPGPLERVHDEITGLPLWRAALSSGLSSRIAEENTTSSAPLIFAAWWPIKTFAPARRSSSIEELSLMSEPLTTAPFVRKSLAMPLIPMPPMPIKWRCLTAF